ncbi:MAG TPA: dienelactone hydrolase family protein [Gemmatimonadales bacterium]|nr:dienelactone hydrolase family protein [Gemmatimonadales bacterium]
MAIRVITATLLMISILAPAVPACGPRERPASASDPAPSDTTVLAGPMTFPNGEATINGFLARPRGEGAFPAVVLTHGNPGIPDDMRSLALELARQGFVALAVDANSRTPDHSKLELHVIRSYTFHRQWMSDIRAGIEWLAGRPFVRDRRVGMVGFCGGGVVNLLLATQSPDVAAVVALYAAPRFPPERNSPTDPKPSLLDFVDRVRVPVQYHYGTADHMIPLADVRRLQDTLARLGAPAEVHLYEGADHAFFGERSPNYDSAAATLARERLIAFLRRHLG